MKTTVTLSKSSAKISGDIFIDRLLKISGVSNIFYAEKTNKLTFSYCSHNVLESVRIALHDMGYPIVFDPDIVI